MTKLTLYNINIGTETYDNFIVRFYESFVNLACNVDTLIHLYNFFHDSIAKILSAQGDGIVIRFLAPMYKRLLPMVLFSWDKSAIEIHTGVW